MRINSHRSLWGSELELAQETVELSLCFFVRRGSVVWILLRGVGKE